MDQITIPTSTSYKLENLIPGTKYKVSVQAKYSDGRVSQSSNSVTFTTLQQPTPPPTSPPVTTSPPPTSPPVTTSPPPTSPPVTTSPPPTSPPVTTSPPPTSPPVTTPAPSGGSYPWSGGEIVGYYMWEGNYAGNSGTPENSWYTGISTAISFTDAQTTTTLSGSSQSTFTTTTTGTFDYTMCPTNTDTNAIFIFTGYSDLRNTLSSTLYAFTNYTTTENMISESVLYFSSTTTPYLIGLVIGGGAQNTGSWNTGDSTATTQVGSDSNYYTGNCGVFSVYEAATIDGQSFSYQESGTGNTISGTGTGTLGLAQSTYTYPFNCLVFDIETWGEEYDGTTTPNGSTGEDFINLFTYIKTSTNSIYKDASLNLTMPIIIVTISHSCGNYNGTGASVIPVIIENAGGYIDYISPQLYTCNLGTINEYVPNSNLVWVPDSPSITTTTPTPTSSMACTSFYDCLTSNPNYTTYGLNCLLPSINFSNLYTTAGSTNSASLPNLYYYETDYSSQALGTEPNASSVAAQDLDSVYPSDTGALGFFNAVFGSSDTNLGGNIQWVNGLLTT